MRRAAVLVPSNIAEGRGRGTDVELIRFCRIASGSLMELETQAELAHRLVLLPNESEVSANVLEQVDPVFFGDIRQAAFKALGLT
jgi:four helix bundle protein